MAPRCSSNAASWALHPVPLPVSPLPTCPRGSLPLVQVSPLRSPPCCLANHLIKADTCHTVLVALPSSIFLPRIHHQLVLRFICFNGASRSSHCSGGSVRAGTVVSPSLTGWMGTCTGQSACRRGPVPPWLGWGSAGTCGQWGHKPHFETWNEQGQTVFAQCPPRALA